MGSDFQDRLNQKAAERRQQELAARKQQEEKAQVDAAQQAKKAAAIFWRSGQTIRDTQLRFAISMAGTARQYPD